MAIIPFLVGLVSVLFLPLSAPVIPLLSHPVYSLFGVEGGAPVSVLKTVISVLGSSFSSMIANNYGLRLRPIFVSRDL